MSLPGSTFSAPATSLIIVAINYSLNAPSGGAQIQIRAGNTVRLMATGNERDDRVSVSRCDVVR